MNFLCLEKLPSIKSLMVVACAALFSLSANCQLYISEASAFKGLTDAVGTESDWIEVYNAGPEPVDLAGYHLSDDTEEWNKWTFPQVLIQPGQYFVILASGKDKPYFADHWETAIYDNSVWRYFPAYGAPPP